MHITKTQKATVKEHTTKHVHIAYGDLEY